MCISKRGLCSIPSAAAASREERILFSSEKRKCFLSFAVRRLHGAEEMLQCCCRKAPTGMCGITAAQATGTAPPEPPVQSAAAGPRFPLSRVCQGNRLCK